MSAPVGRTKLNRGVTHGNDRTRSDHIASDLRAEAEKILEKRELKGQHRATLDTAFNAAWGLLLIDAPLLARTRDHAMTGNYADHHDCHIKPDLVLIYFKPDDILNRNAQNRIAQRTRHMKNGTHVAP